MPKDLGDLLYSKCKANYNHKYKNEPCWEMLTKPQPNGYVNFSYRLGGILITESAHVMSYKISHNVESIPNGYAIDHMCVNRICINPAHLQRVTQTENNRLIHNRSD